MSIVRKISITDKNRMYLKVCVEAFY